MSVHERKYAIAGHAAAQIVEHAGVLYWVEDAPDHHLKHVNAQLRKIADALGFDIVKKASQPAEVIVSEAAE